MCRLMALWAKRKKEKSSKHLLKGWLNSWLKSTKYDQRLKDVYSVQKRNCVHKDGWGVVSVGANHHCNIEWEQKNMDIKPAFNYKRNSLTSSILIPPLINSTNQILVAHARRASINMPITLQQVQPFLINENKGLMRIYLSHNGNLSSEIINEVLTEEMQLNSQKLKELSDTQVLNWYIWQKIVKERLSSKNSVKKFWIPILQEIIDKHQDKNQNYQMQLIILEILENKPQLIACSSLSDKSSRMMPYYSLYSGKKDSFHVLCSSTVADYFQNTHKTKTWNLKQVPNKMIINLTSEGEFSHNLE